MRNESNTRAKQFEGAVSALPIKIAFGAHRLNPQFLLNYVKITMQV